MLPVLRAIVGFLSVVVLPALAAISGFLVSTHAFNFPLAARIPLASLALVSFSAAGFFETWIYVRELRSVAPRPIPSAISFVARLATVFFGTAATFLCALAAGIFFSHPATGLGLAPFLALFCYAALSWWLLTPRIDLVRGRVFRAYREVFFKSLEEFRARERIFFGGIWIPWSAAVKHFLILGATGSGKTMVFDLLAQSTLRGRVGRGQDQRGLWFDAKTEAVPRLSALGVPYKILNPFDRRGVALDIKWMVPTRAAAMELSGILMPQMKGTSSDPFWVDSPRNILSSVLTSLRLGVPRANGDREAIDWDLRDVVLVMGSLERIREVVTRNPECGDDLDGYFDDAKLSASLLATIKTAMMWYRPIAACWHRAGEKISLDDCVSGEEVMLVLGNREESRMAINAINRAIVSRYAQLALSRGDSKTRRIWFFLDEFPDLKRLDPDAMKGLLTKGRSKGLSVILGIQTLSSVANEYGPDDANTILSQCQNLAVLGLGDLDAESAEYVMRGIGESERHEYLGTNTPQGLAIKRTTRTQLQSRPVVLSSELTDLPETSPANGLPGYYRTRSTRGWWGAVIPGKFLERTLTRPAADVQAIVERPLSEHELEPWNEADFERLGLSREPVRHPEQEVAPKSGKRFRVYRGGKLAEFAA